MAAEIKENNQEIEKDWRAESERLFFKEHMTVTAIASQVGCTRKYVAAHLKSMPGYLEERQRRKSESQEKRKEQQRQWDRDNRSGGGNINERAMLLNDHVQAVRELSHERYY